MKISGVVYAENCAQAWFLIQEKNPDCNRKTVSIVEDKSGFRDGLRKFHYEIERGEVIET